MPATTAPPTPQPQAPASPDRPDPSFWGDERRTRGARIPRPRADGIDALRDRVQAWRTDSRAAVVVLVIVAVVAGVLWYRIGAGGGDAPPSRTRSAAVTTATPARADEAAGTSPTTDSRGPKAIVHVAGAVSRPGVLELAAGARVIDAVEGAGGALPEANLDELNLAAKVADGQRVYVPRVGELGLTPTDASGSAADPGAGGGGGLLNLNTATQAQLEELPGIGPVLATAVIDERDRRGGFRSVNELRDVRGIGEKRFEDLRDQVTV